MVNKQEKDIIQGNGNRTFTTPDGRRYSIDGQYNVLGRQSDATEQPRQLSKEPKLIFGKSGEGKTMGGGWRPEKKSSTIPEGKDQVKQSKKKGPGISK